jgi:CubicO group peptidase (beta-lactamase class C family)
MGKISIKAGLIILWASIVIVVFVIEEKFRKPPVEKGDSTSIENYAVQKLNDALANRNLGSVAMALIQNGQIKAEYGLGVGNIQTNSSVKTNETLYLLSSLSKVVTAWGVMKLVQDGKLLLDEPVLPHLTRWRFPGSELYRDKVTARHLLSHTAGFVDGYGHGGFLPGQEVQTIDESLILPKDANKGEAHAAIIVFEPGTAMSYSSAGYAVLQLLIEEVSGQSFNDYMKESVLEPLGMTKSDFDLDAVIDEGREEELATNYDLEMKPHSYRRYANMAGVSLLSTAHDLAQLVMAYYNENPLLSKESLKEFSTPQPGTSFSWGLGHTLYGTNGVGGYVIGHGGGAFPALGAEMRLNPATGNGIVIVASGTQNLISEIGDVWTYWETGHRTFDIRNVVRKRLVHALAAIFIGTLAIVFWKKPGFLIRKIN